MKKKHLETLILGAVVLLIFTGSLFTANVDSDIESNARKSYVFKNYLKDQDIEIRSQNGAVTLTGSVQNEAQREMAADVIRNMEGVRSVDNRLTISCPSSGQQADSWIHSRVHAMLNMNTFSDPERTQVEVRDGRVTISGQANNQATKDMITERVREMEGVKEVNNRMTISSTPQRGMTRAEDIDDSSIKTQAKMALSYCGFTGFDGQSTSYMKGSQWGKTAGQKTGKTAYRNTFLHDPDIKVNNGTVTITGSIQDNAEKSRVTRCLENLHGVSRVDNQLKVEGTGKSESN